MGHWSQDTRTITIYQESSYAVVQCVNRPRGPKKKIKQDLWEQTSLFCGQSAMDGLASPLCCCVEDVAELDHGRGWTEPVVVVVLSHVRVFETPWTCSPPGFSIHGIFHARMLEWVAIPGDIPNLGIKPTSLASPVLAGGFSTTAPPGKPQMLPWGHHRWGYVIICLRC